MHDDTTLTTGRVTRVLTERIWPAVHAVSVPFTVEAHTLPGEPVSPSEGLALDYEPYAVGSPWGAAWGTTWFRLTGAVPAEWAGRRVEAVVDLGFDVAEPGFQCEGLVYRPDGSPVKAVNPRNHWALVAAPAQGGERVELYVEGASNPVVFGPVRFKPTTQGDLLTASPDLLYSTRRMDLAVFDEEVHALALDLDVLLGLQAELPAGQRRSRILQAMDDALDRLDLADVSGTATAARAALGEVLARPAGASAHVVSAVGHAHIDSAWLWPVRETVRKVARTTASMAALIDETEDFVYGMSSAQQYAWVKEHRPEVWSRVVAAVQARRFLPLGGMWVESDTVMPSGESMVRQFLYGQRFFEEELGVRSQGVWLPDSFGYSPALPQLVRRAGFEWFFTQKISWNQVNTFPHHTFLWEGIDGSRVLTHFPPMDTYNSELSGAELALADRQFRDHRIASGSIAPVGWGDGGGGTTREMTGRAERLADLEGSPRVRWEHPDDFYARTRAELVGEDGRPRPGTPVWVGELYLELHRATLTSQHRTKAGNRRCEHLLVEAELWATTAAVRAGAAYPHDELDALWKQVLLHQFHDILPGTSIAWVHREAVEQYARVEREAEALVARSLAALVGEGTTRIALNGAASERAGVPSGAGVAGENLGADLGAGPVEVVRNGADLVLDNDVVRVTLSAQGLVTSAVDLASGRDAIAPGRAAGLLQLHPDLPNKWDAWDVDRFYRNTVRDLRDADSLDASVDQRGVARVVVERTISAKSTVRQVFSLAPGSRTLDVEQVTDWHEVETFLKVAFPLDVRAEHTSAETQFGHQRRATHVNTSWEVARFETSMHRFVHVEEPGFGVALVNDSTYGYDVTRDWVEDGALGTTVRLSLLRAPRFPDPDTDHGAHTHRYGLVIGTGVAGAAQEGVRLNTPAREVLGAHGFEPLVRVEGDGVALSSVKLAADRSGDLVVRVHEVLGGRTSGTLHVDTDVESASAVTLLEEPLGQPSPGEEATRGRGPAVVDVELGPFEVRTLRFTRRPPRR
ncbi:glycoside hydrolase family 38 C-terminal domain-containing protein [Phycicoccus sp. Soil803]|uniref:alpha-mannosidase n=1 Tax=Phycicoccus sp. Soil803 TaxID=1736415 RepID=UPI00070E278B|nr:glycoside hydrolase family 38 C-terminal domain-containing protein [Phycicoccus sp. Soil803]KRF26421.1 alpha-mannosidase [Phycicoccus sp. Soil803]